MKKLLFIAAAMLVMVSCGSKEKTPEQRAEEFAREFVAGISAEDVDKVLSVQKDVRSYGETLDDETLEKFLDSFDACVRKLNEEFSEEEMMRAMSFVFEHQDLFE